jgi:hypothetical protein
MAKFQLIPANGEKPLEEFEGSWLEVNGDTVLVMGESEASGAYKAVHIVRMLPGWVIKRAG